MTAQTSFARLYASTQRFTLGTPRSFAIAPDGERVLFLRAASGVDRRTNLYELSVSDGAERLVADSATLLAGDDEDLSPAERARRERARESAAGIVGYATDKAVRVAAFTVSGRLFVADLTTRQVNELPAVAPVFDPRPSPDGRHVAYVSGGALRVIGVDGAGDRALAEPAADEAENVSYGLADFVAAEEMDRGRGFWWSPASDALLATRVDTTPVRRWHIADPANPERPATVLPYPAAGTDNATTELLLFGLDGARRTVVWQSPAAGQREYLARVSWPASGPPLLATQSRDQRSVEILSVDAATGQTSLAHAETDPRWLELFGGVPAWTPDGRLVHVAPRDGAHRVLVDGEPVTPADLHVRSVLDVGADIAFSASPDEDPTQIHLYVAGADGVRQLTAEPGVHSGLRSGRLTVTSWSGLDHDGARVRVWRDSAVAHTVDSLALTPPLRPNLRLRVAGERGLRCALLLPTGHEPGAPLPVLLDPYGGPGAQRVLSARNAYLSSQWFADQGFAVLVTDGRGTPGRSVNFSQAIDRDFAGVTLDDQVDALHAVAALHPELDLSRVAIRGWSYGGYLAALAVLRRPDVFHAAVAGAPVTDWRLYDTHYTERYLGHPDVEPEVYERNSLLADADKLTRPLMLIHGLADDNVVVAHTLRLSAALLAAGRPHTVLPLSGVTHMTPQEQVAENLLLLQVDFLKTALAHAPG